MAIHRVWTVKILNFTLSKIETWLYYRNIQGMHICSIYSQSIWKSWTKISGGADIYNIWRINSILVGVLVALHFGLGAKMSTPSKILIYTSSWHETWYKIFQHFCSNVTRKVCLEVYSNKFNFTQALESNYIDSNGLYSQKRLTLKNQLIIFASYVTLWEKVGCGEPYADIIF